MAFGNTLAVRPELLLATLFLALPIGCGRPDGRSAHGPRRPDVLLLCLEDASPQRFGCYGNRVCRTPNIDRLARQAVRFDQAHCTAPPCCPSRTSLLSGLRAHTTKVFGNDDDWSQRLRPGSTMPEYFMANGYDAIRIGKLFHSGHRGRKFSDSDRWTRTYEGPEGLGRSGGRRRPLAGPGVAVAKRKAAAAAAGKFVSAGGSPFTYGPSGLADLDEIDGMIATQAVRILGQKRRKPLFLAVGFHRPHLPFTAPDKYFAMYRPADVTLPDNPAADSSGMPLDQELLEPFNPHTAEQWREAIAAYYAALTFVDAQVGRVLAALARSGRADNTIVVLWSDHGFLLGEHFLWRKGPLNDYSTKVAMIVKAPGVTTAGAVCKRPAESVDLFPTLADLCGLAIPPGLEGISMRPLLKDPARPWKKGALITSGRSATSVCTERWRYNEYTGPAARTELFDRTADPGEWVNLADDPQYAETVAEFHRRIQAGWRACLPD